MRKLFSTFVLLLSLSYGSLKHIDLTSGLGIIGGTEVAIKDVPFMAIVLGRNSMYIWNCGGSIVDEQHVITAAHCCLGPNHNSTGVSMTVKVGTDRYSEGQELKVEKATANPDYKPKEHKRGSDVCVLKLQEKLSFTTTVNTLPMADKEYELNDGEFLETIGFGITEDGNGSEKLLKVSLPYMSPDKCNKVYEGGISETMLCAGGVKGKGVCFGDSGSPIFYNDRLVGLSSFVQNEQCDESKYPAVFARISALRPFIEKVVKDDF